MIFFKGLKGVVIFFLYYIMCGVVAVVGYGLLHLGTSTPVLGASGAVFGLMGGALRLLGRRNKGPVPLTNRRFLRASMILMTVNAMFGLAGFVPGMGGVQIAWEAHAIGYVAGALLIGPLFVWFSPNPGRFDSLGDVSDARL